MVSPRLHRRRSPSAVPPPSVEAALARALHLRARVAALRANAEAAAEPLEAEAAWLEEAPERAADAEGRRAAAAEALALADTEASDLAAAMAAWGTARSAIDTVCRDTDRLLAERQELHRILADPDTPTRDHLAADRDHAAYVGLLDTQTTALRTAEDTANRAAMQVWLGLRQVRHWRAVATARCDPAGLPPPSWPSLPTDTEAGLAEADPTASTRMLVPTPIQRQVAERLLAVAAALDADAPNHSGGWPVDPSRPRAGLGAPRTP